MRNQFRGFFVHVLPASLPYASIAACLGAWLLQQFSPRHSQSRSVELVVTA